jgi:predicted N-formylglutamate amidohydrolase
VAVGAAISCRALDRLGIADAVRTPDRLDVGIAGLGRLLADALGATLIQQNYSRLVIVCNRPLDATTSISVINEHSPIPGNVGSSEAARGVRAREIFCPYHQGIEAELVRWRQTGRPAAPVFERPNVLRYC